MKLIDGDALFAKVARLKKYLLVEPYTAKHIEYGYYADDILAAIHQMPEVDASSAMQERVAAVQYERYATSEQITQEKTVQVVHCKDCKHRGDFNICPMAHISLGDPPYDENSDFTKDDGFCDRGEKIDG